MAELLEAVVSWPSLVLVSVMFGFAPGFCLRLIVLAYPRRAELIAELYAVPRIQRPLWVAEQLEVALFEAHRPLAHRPPGQQQAVPLPEIAPPPVPKPDEAGGAGWDTSKETYDLVRPYSLTEGRNASCVDLAVETLVSATGRLPDPVARPEHRTILRLCATPLRLQSSPPCCRCPSEWPEYCWATWPRRAASRYTARQAPLTPHRTLP